MQYFSSETLQFHIGVLKMSEFEKNLNHLIYLLRMEKINKKDMHDSLQLLCHLMFFKLFVVGRYLPGKSKMADLRQIFCPHTWTVLSQEVLTKFI